MPLHIQILSAPYTLSFGYIEILMSQRDSFVEFRITECVLFAGCTLLDVPEFGLTMLIANVRRIKLFVQDPKCPYDAYSRLQLDRVTRCQYLSTVR